MPILFGHSRRVLDLAQFTRHLEGAMRAKAPLSEVIASYAGDADTRTMQRAVRILAPRLEAGATLAQAMDEAPDIFPESYRRIIRMGEQSQSLPGVVAGLARALEEGVSLHESFRRAAIYPTIVLSILFLQMSFLAIVGLPKLADISIQFSSEVSTAVHTGGIMTAIPMALLLVCLLWFLLAGAGLLWNSHRKGMFLLSLPLIGPAARLAETARFVRHLGLMLDNRVPLNEALGLMADSTTNGYVADALRDFKTRLEQGESLGNLIGTQPVFPPALSVMVSSAQERGHLAETLGHLSEFYRERAQNAMRVIREFFEPLLLVVVGVLIIWVALSVYLPLFTISKSAVMF